MRDLVSKYSKYYYYYYYYYYKFGKTDYFDCTIHR